MPTINKTIRIFQFIKGYIASNKVSPTITEIGRHFQMTSTASVYAHIKKMVALGWITIVPNVNRGIRIAEQEQKDAA